MNSKLKSRRLIDAEDDKEGAKQALIEGYEGEGGIDELRDYDGITVTSDWTGEAMISEIEIDPDKVDFDDIKKQRRLGRNLQNDQDLFSNTLHQKHGKEWL